jgi:hypothetical protein
VRLTRLLAVFLLVIPSVLGAQSYVAQPTIIAVSNVNLNSVGSDTEVKIQLSKYIARRITVTNASVSLAASPATLGLFTATGGGGTNVIPFTTMTSLNTSAKFAEMTFSFSSVSSFPSVYLRNGTAHGSPATVDVYIEVTPLL